MYDPEMRKDCQMRENFENCSPVGGFDEICEAVDNAFQGIYNVLKAMKERGAVEPIFKQDEDGIVWACGSCGAYMYHNGGISKAKEYAKYCRQCGRKVKWE